MLISLPKAVVLPPTTMTHGQCDAIRIRLPSQLNAGTKFMLLDDSEKGLVQL